MKKNRNSLSNHKRANWIVKLSLLPMFKQYGRERFELFPLYILDINLRYCYQELSKFI